MSTTNLGKQILELREQGLSYNKIVERLGCSKSTVSYWCSNTTKITTKERKTRYKKENPGLVKFQKAIDFFKARIKNPVKQKMCLDWNKRIRTCTSHFRLRKGIMVNDNYTYHDVITHLGGTNTKCYLTGTPINIETDKYSLDHIVPVEKGGTNELDNLGITIPEANASKTNLTVEEYVNLCKKVLENFGYTISKNN